MAPFPAPLTADAGGEALGTDAVLYAGGVVFRGGGVADCVLRGPGPERSVWALPVALDTSFAAVVIVLADMLMGRGVAVVYTGSVVSALRALHSVWRLLTFWKESGFAML